MNTLVIVLIAIVVLGAGYVLYGRHIAKSWGIDPKAETPAVKYNDGKDFVPTNGVQPSIFLYCRCRPGYRRHSGGGFWLGTGAAVDPDRRRFLRRRYGLRCPVRFCEERGQEHGYAH